MVGQPAADGLLCDHVGARADRRGVSDHAPLIADLGVAWRRTQVVPAERRDTTESCLLLPLIRWAVTAELQVGELTVSCLLTSERAPMSCVCQGAVSRGRQPG